MITTKLEINMLRTIYANVKQFILQPANLLRKSFQNFKNNLSTFLDFC